MGLHKLSRMIWGFNGTDCYGMGFHGTTMGFHGTDCYGDAMKVVWHCYEIPGTPLYGTSHGITISVAYHVAFPCVSHGTAMLPVP